MAATKPTSLPDHLPCPLRIATAQQGTTSTIELEGEWDIAQFGATRDAVAQALRRRPECLVIDLSRLSFIDSTGIRVLIETHKRCTEQETRLVIIPGRHAVQRVFEVCQLIDSLPFAAHNGSLQSRESLENEHRRT
jgi:anti-anti-sigma factor